MTRIETLIQYADLRESARSVLAYVVRSGGEVAGTAASIADAVEMSERTVFRALDELADAGLVMVTTAAGAGVHPTGRRGSGPARPGAILPRDRHRPEVGAGAWCGDGEGGDLTSWAV